MYGIGLALGMLCLGLGYAARLRTLGIGTLPELLEKKYESPLLKRAAAVLSVISLAGILMCQAIGLKKFLCSMGFASDWTFLLSWGAVVFYTTCGGSFGRRVDGCHPGRHHDRDACHYVLLRPAAAVAGHQRPDDRYGLAIDGPILSSLVIPFCFIFVGQDMAQRCFAAKTPKDAT